jgi:hypothetical protein
MEITTGDLATKAPPGGERGPDRAADRVEVYLAPSRRAHLPGLLGLLVRGFGLDVFGGSLLGRQAALALQFSAFLLVVIVCFDFVAWTLLFNSIFHASGDILDHDGWTAVAAVFGLLFAAAVFVYERQFFTADTSDLLRSPGRFLAVATAVAIRIAILFAAALITAQPIELLVFREPLRKRIHEEAVRQEVMVSVRKLAELQDKIKQLALQPEQLDAKMRGTREAADLALAKKTSARENGWLESLRRQLASTQAAVNQAALHQPPEGADASDLQGSLRRIEGQIRSQTRAADAARTAVGDAEARFERRRQELYGGEVKQQASNEQQQEAVRLYIDDVKKRGMKEKVSREVPGADPRIAPARFSYEYRGSDFFDQLRILGDRIDGRAARWPEGVPEKERRRHALELGLGELTAGQAAAVGDGARRCSLLPWSAARKAPGGPEVERTIAEACLFRRSYAVAYAIGMVIPLLVFAVKFLMPRELKHYFSVRQQAWAGNPEALACQRGEDKRRQEREDARARRREQRDEARRRPRRWMFGRRETASV